MLKISKLADYATIVMHWFSRHSDERYSASVVSEQLGIATPTISKVLKQLNEAGLLTSTRGAQGGYQLSRPSEQISLAAILMAIDGRPAVTECSQMDNACQYEQCCELRGNWQYINRVIYSVLEHLTLKDMTASLTHSHISPLQFMPASGPLHTGALK